MKCNEFVLYEKMGKYKRNKKVNVDNVPEIEWDRKQEAKKSPNG
jgi:hypothetical protein